MLPLVSTAWFGSAIKLPGRTLASAGMKRPPAAASKTLTATMRQRQTAALSDPPIRKRAGDARIELRDNAFGLRGHPNQSVGKAVSFVGPLGSDFITGRSARGHKRALPSWPHPTTVPSPEIWPTSPSTP